MIWTLHVHRSVTHTVRHLPRPIFEQVWPSIMSLKKNQQPEEATQVTGFENTYEYTIAGYSVVFQVQTEERIVRVIRLHQQLSS